MYACISEPGRGFFEGVCTRNQVPYFRRDPPAPPHNSRIGSGRHALNAPIDPGLCVIVYIDFRKSHTQLGE
jgi:hypothetical protein